MKTEPTPERLTQRERRERTRAALLSAATEVFARKGFAAARVEEIADCAHLTTGALYGHFRSKQELFLAVFDQFAAQRVQEVEQTATASSAGELSVKAGADQWMNQLDATPWRFWLHLEFAHYASSDPALQERFALSIRAVRDAISRLVEQQAKDRELELPVSADWLATVVRALGMGLSLERLSDPDTVPSEMFGQALELILTMVESTASPHNKTEVDPV